MPNDIKTPTAPPPSLDQVVRRQDVPIIAVIAYNPDAPEGHEVRVALTDICKGMLATLTDFELKVFATEVSLVVRKRLEMPPSPNYQAHPTAAGGEDGAQQQESK